MAIYKVLKRIIKQFILQYMSESFFERAVIIKTFFTKEAFAYRLMRMCRVKDDKIVISNMCGKGFGDNPKYIALELLKSNRYDIVWLINDLKDDSIPCEIRKVKYGSWKAYYELSTAKVWIDNARKLSGTIKKKNQYYIHTGHGGVPLKKVEAAAERLDSAYIVHAKNDSKKIDLMLSNSDVKTRICKKDYWYEGEIAEWGSPKVEALKCKDSIIEYKIKERYGIKKETNVLLYAPTFRNADSRLSNADLIKLDYIKIKETLERQFGGEWVIFIRLHPIISAMASELKIKDLNVIDVTDYPDMQELLIMCNMMITDYSGTMFEMLQISKSVILYAPDIDSYDRGFYFELSELPFLIAETETELLNAIECFSKEQYEKDINEFKKKIGLIETKVSAKKCAERISQVISGEFFVK